ncbi:MAG: DUF6807 family protein [Opitutaceae bacterium]
MNDTSPQLRRRGFLGTALAAASGMAVTRMLPGATVAPKTAPGKFTLLDQKPWGNQTRRLKITRGAQPVASLIFPTDYPTHFRLKPELHHVCTPSGVAVTGSHEYCFIHHQSIMCGHGKVQADGDERMIDFYRHLPFPFPGRRDPNRAPNAKNNLFQLGPSGLQRITQARWRVADEVVLHLELAWQTRAMDREVGDTIATEERFYRIANSEHGTVVDVFSKLMPADRPVTLIPENDHGYIGVRVHDFIDVDDGGIMRDSEGRTNPTEHFREATGERRIPRWVDCTGRIGTATVGMAIMSHPGNVRNQWYMREFGLMIISAAQTAPLRITAEKPFEFAVRFVAHDGVLAPAAANRLHADFSATRADELRVFMRS